MSVHVEPTGVDGEYALSVGTRNVGVIVVGSELTDNDGFWQTTTSAPPVEPHQALIGAWDTDGEFIRLHTADLRNDLQSSPDPKASNA